MRIERAETLRLAIPFREPYVTARGKLHEREVVLLRLWADSGQEGLGEGVPLSLRGDAPAAEVERWTSDAATRIVGLDLAPVTEDPIGFAVATAIELAGPRKMPRAAAAALECAVFDLTARIVQRPLWSLLGAGEVKAVRCNATLTTGAPEEVAEQAREWRAEGFETFKLKLGGAGSDPAAVVAAVREAVGDKARIRVDANEAWSVEEAAGALAAIEPHAIELAEQPVAGLRELARLAGETSIPLCADEAVASLADANRALGRAACAYATAKLSKVGGFGAARQIAGVIPTYLSSALDGPVGIAAAAHAAQLIRADGNDPGLAHGLATQRLFATEIASVGCELKGGDLHLPDGAGLGVELDEGALAACTVASSTVIWPANG